MFKEHNIPFGIHEHKGIIIFSLTVLKNIDIIINIYFKIS
jgi:hypothetical protein